MKIYMDYIDSIYLKDKMERTDFSKYEILFVTPAQILNGEVIIYLVCTRELAI